MRRVTPLISVAFFFLTPVTLAYTCPDYDAIRQPSVDASIFSIDDFAGKWYLVATNEPTIPSFCTCGINTYRIHSNDGWYSYKNTDNCVGAINISVPIKGETSQDPASPGYLRENFGPFNHTIRNLDPNMIFEATYVDGVMDLAITYACISKRLYSFDVLSRSSSWTQKELEQVVNDANATTGGLLRVDGMRYNDHAAYEDCGLA